MTYDIENIKTILGGTVVFLLIFYILPYLFIFERSMDKLFLFYSKFLYYNSDSIWDYFFWETEMNRLKKRIKKRKQSKLR